MALLDSFVPSPDRLFPCGHTVVDHAICVCGLPAGHGGVTPGEHHATVCDDHHLNPVCPHCGKVTSTIYRNCAHCNKRIR